MRRRFWLPLLASVLLWAIAPAGARAATLEDIGNELICQCGCNMVLINCNHQECGVRESMLADIRQRLDRGESRDQIVQAFIQQYGEVVLAAPPKRGFNLVAWITPFAALLAGAGVIYIAITTWVKRGAVQAPKPGAVKEDDEKYLARLEQELKTFRDGSFR